MPVDTFIHGVTPCTVPNSGVTSKLFDPTRIITPGAISANGQVVQNLVIDGRIVPGTTCAAMKGVTLSQVQIVVDAADLPAGTGDTGALHLYNIDVEDWYIEHVDIIIKNPSYRWYGIFGHDFHVSRPYIKGSTDGIMVTCAFNAAAGTPQRVKIHDPFIEGLVWSAVDPNHVDGTHNDGIQLSALASGLIDQVEIIGGDITLPTNGTSLVQVNVPEIKSLNIRGIKGRGGKSGVNFVNTLDEFGDTSVTFCEFDIDSMSQHAWIYAGSGSVFRTEGNREPDGTPLVGFNNG